MIGIMASAGSGAGGPPPELIVNGTFTTDTTGWNTTLTNATVSVVSGRLRVTATASFPRTEQSVGVTNGVQHTFLYDHFAGTASPIVRIGTTTDGSDLLSDSTAAVGESFVFTPAVSTVYISLWVNTGTVGEYAEFDNLSLKAV